MFWHTSVKHESDEGVSIRQVPEDRPVFEREYKVAVPRGVTMKINIKTYGWTTGTYYSGELSQTNGQWVLFDPQNPADKILDREILPIVQQRCQQILSVDAEWRASQPASFTDKFGTTWARQ